MDGPRFDFCYFFLAVVRAAGFRVCFFAGAAFLFAIKLEFTSFLF